MLFMVDAHLCGQASCHLRGCKGNAAEQVVVLPRDLHPDTSVYGIAIDVHDFDPQVVDPRAPAPVPPSHPSTVRHTTSTPLSRSGVTAAFAAVITSAPLEVRSALSVECFNALAEIF